MAYNYGPPPPAPPAAHYYHQASGSSGYSGHGGRGRGGISAERGRYNGAPAAYGYGSHPPSQPYGMQSGVPYVGQHAGPAGYPSQQLHNQQQPHQPPQSHPQQWHADQSQHQQTPAHPHLPASNYHPNYAPQLYQQTPSSQLPQHPTQPHGHYGPQTAYPVAPQPAYPQGYHPQAPSQPQAQHWGPSPGARGHPSGSRGRGGYHERGGKSVMMGPPIRMGFETDTAQGHPAPVSNNFPPAPYGGPHGGATPYPPVPYPPYAVAPAAPYMHGAYDSSAHNSRGRGGSHHHGNSKSRSHFGGDKMRNRNRGGHTQTSPAHHQKPDGAPSGKKKKRKTNTLGLTPGDESEEDDENEEQRLNELYGADAPNPTTATDIQEWIATRRANFPTKSRVEARKAAGHQSNGEAKKVKDALEQKAERLRKKLEKVESSIKRKREQQDEGDEMRDVGTALSSPSDVKSEDEKPEVMSSRLEPGSVPPPPRKADPTRHCKYYSTGGTCGKKGKCRFVHDPAVREAALQEREMNGGRMTLQQRLTLNDKDQEDLTIVQTLKYLQDRGMLQNGASPPPSSPGSQADSVSHSPILEASNHGLPPIPPPSVFT